MPCDWLYSSIKKLVYQKVSLILFFYKYIKYKMNQSQQFLRKKKRMFKFKVKEKQFLRKRK